MRRLLAWASAVVVLCGWLLALHPTGALAASAGTWGTAMKVPGLATLDRNGYAAITSVSCPSPGNCAAAGSYSAGLGKSAQGFVVSEVHGTWQKARSVPGLATLNARGDAEITTISCASAGNCSAGGFYEGQDQNQQAGHQQAFVVSEVRGTWGKAEQVPGSHAMNTTGYASVTAVSCPSAGTCSAVGYYTGSRPSLFVVSEVRGKWGAAAQMPGIATLNQTNAPAVLSLSCGAPGYCSAGGYYNDRNALLQAFVVSEANGQWSAAQEVPGTATLNRGPTAKTSSVACPSAGFCVAVGFYEDYYGGQHPFIATQAHGAWLLAEKVAGTTAGSMLDTVSCASAAYCGAGGQVYAGAARWQAIVVTDVRGTWGPARQVPGIAALNKAGSAAVTGMSCSSTANCGAVGYYNPGNSSPHPFVVSQVNGSWRRALQVPGAAKVGKLLQIASISCGGPGNCSAGGSYRKNVNGDNAFVVSETTPQVHVLRVGTLTGPQVTQGAKLRAQLAAGARATFATALGKVTCTSASLAATVTSNPARPGTATEKVTALSYATCTISARRVTVTSVRAGDLPYRAKVSDGTGDPVTFSGQSRARPLTVTVTFKSGASTFSCRYTAASITGRASNRGNSVGFAKQSLTRASGQSRCPATAIFTATFGPVRDVSRASHPKVFVS